LPGTVTVPDADKRAQGRVAVESFILQGSVQRRYTLEALAKWAPPISRSSKSSGNKKLPEIDMGAVEAGDYDDLPPELREKFEAYCRERPVVAGLWRGEPAPRQTDVSASGFEFQLIGWLKKPGKFNPTEAAQLVAVYPFRSEKHADELERRVKRAWANHSSAYGAEGLDPVSIAPPNAAASRDQDTALVTDAKPPANDTRLEDISPLEPFTGEDLPEIPWVIERFLLRRAKRAGLRWPLPEDLSDEALERLVYPPVLIAAKDSIA
jgi:hypothetical protein